MVDFSSLSSITNWIQRISSKYHFALNSSWFCTASFRLKDTPSTIRDVLYQEQGLTPSRHTASFAFPMSVIHTSMKPYQTKERRYINKGYSFLILQDAHSVVMLQFWWKMPETNPFWEPQTSESLRRNDAKFVIHLTYCLVFPLDFFWDWQPKQIPYHFQNPQTCTNKL